LTSRQRRFDWEDVYRLSVELVVGVCQPAPGESAKRRSAISRAYYATYNLARAAAARDGAKFKQRGSDHQLLISWYSTRNPALSKQLSRLRNARRKADYDDVFETPEAFTKQLLRRASEAIALLGKP
jgi:uncharacterized protein (UPF0332 family)